MQINNIIDSHIHVNLKNNSVISDMINQMDSNSVKQSVLIINTEEEMNAILNEIQLIIKNKDKFHVVAGLNVHSDNPYSIIDSVKKAGFDFSIKLHPRLYKYRHNDFDKILLYLTQKNDYQNIIIDTLFNNPFFEYHTGIELGVFLARHLPDRKIILAHAGATKLLECFASTRLLRNIYYDLSFTATYFDNTSIRFDMINYLKYTSSRIMFGSDYPSFSVNLAISKLYNLCLEAGLSADEIEFVFGGTAQKVYFNR